MPDFKGVNNLYFILVFIVPGLVIVFVRSRFISGKAPSHTENILGYIVVSLLYYSLIVPFIESILDFRGPLVERAVLWIGITLAGPAIFGIFLGAWAQKDWGTWIAHRIGLSTVHVIPAAWDWRFSKMPHGGMFVMVTLTSGERVVGLFGTKSFGDVTLYIPIRKG